MHKPYPTPFVKQLIDPTGQATLGVFDAPVPDINGRDCDYRTQMNGKASKFRKHFNYKQFQYFGAISDDLIFGCALADLRYIGACFIYVFRPSDGAMRTWQYKTPLATGMQLNRRTDNGDSTFRKGKRHIKQSYTLHQDGSRTKRLTVKIPNELTIDASMIEQSDYQCMALCTPCAVNGWIYAQKVAAAPVTGNVSCALGSYDLGEIHSYGHHDFSAGFMRRETFWNWACLSAPPSESLPALGLNISWGVNETGYSENCLWLGNECFSLPPVQFQFTRDEIMQPWAITSADGRINLSFEPIGLHQERLNVGLMATNFKQLFGHFNGRIQTHEGQDIEIKQLLGFVEDQFSRW